MQTECKDHGACPSEALIEAEINAEMKKLSAEWCLEKTKPNKISREFKFKNFSQALEFVNKVGVIAETMNHHPDINLKWGSVCVEYWTHNANGLTQMDFDAAIKLMRCKCDNDYVRDCSSVAKRCDSNAMKKIISKKCDNVK